MSRPWTTTVIHVRSRYTAEVHEMTTPSTSPPPTTICQGRPWVVGLSRLFSMLNARIDAADPTSQLYL